MACGGGRPVPWWEPGQRLALGTGNRLKLGLFGANLAGIGLTTVPEAWPARWDENLEVARMAEAAGFDFLLPVARWKGYGGQTDPQGTSLETITWATALLAATQRITVFATVHVPLVHPVFAAKQFVTADQVGHGRFALNVVCGWNEDEFDMFGVPRPAESRYRFADEWLGIVKRIWSEREPFDHAGEFFQLRDVRAMPKPFGNERPVILNAGQSADGRAFAARACDILFSGPPRAAEAGWADMLGQLRQDAGRPDFPVFTSTVVICRQTRREAQDFLDYCTRHGDEQAIDNILAVKLRSGRGVAAMDPAVARREAAKATATYVVGDPDDVADQFAAMAEGGVNGIAAMLTNQKAELPFLIQEVLPRLARLDWRVDC